MEELKLLQRSAGYAVIVKPRGMESEGGTGKEHVPAALSGMLACRPEDVYPVHRLDKPTGGVMVYALNARTAAVLSRSLQEGRFEKEYLAVTDRAPAEKSGAWTDLVYWDSRARKSFVVDRDRKGVREARLEYSLVKQLKEGRALLRIRLLTGRTHQIRVQCAHRGLPVTGDRRYGSRASSKMLGLWCETLRFPDPETGKELSFTCPPPREEPFEEEENSFYFEGFMV